MIIVDAKPSALVGTLDFIDDLIKNKDIVLVPVSSFIETKENNWNIVRIINEIS
nr:MAG: hypothetical protein BWY78_01364 [Alphaproteobacteria bacterium ADurb.Bin438]